MRLTQRALLLSEAFIAQRRVHLAPEPEGPRSGIANPADCNNATPVTMLVLGDSMVAGCGVTSTTESMVPNIAHGMSERLHRPVQWELNGKLGATMRRVRYRMLPELSAGDNEQSDVLVVCAGSNDLMAQRSLEEWKTDLTEVVKSAKEKARSVVVLSSGQLYKSPSLGHSLRREVEHRTDAQTEMSKRVCKQYGVTYIDLTHEPLRAETQEFWASDHFHPSGLGYTLIAEAVVPQLLAGAHL